MQAISVKWKDIILYVIIPNEAVSVLNGFYILIDKSQIYYDKSGILFCLKLKLEVSILVTAIQKITLLIVSADSKVIIIEFILNNLIMGTRNNSKSIPHKIFLFMLHDNRIQH